MLYLTSVRSEDIQEIEGRFRASGIPIYTDPDYSQRDGFVSGIGSSYSNATRLPDWYRINVCLDEQFEEAKLLFENPSYTVKWPVDVAQFEATMNELSTQEIRPLNSENILNRISIIVVVAFAIWILYVVLLRK